MQIKITMSRNTYAPYYLVVDLYKTDIAYINPSLHEEDIVNTVGKINIKFDESEESYAMLIKAIEIQVNRCLAEV